MYFMGFHTQKVGQLCLVRIQNISVSFNELNHTLAIFHFLQHSNKNYLKSEDMIKIIFFLLCSLNLKLCIKILHVHIYSLLLFQIFLSMEIKLFYQCLNFKLKLVFVK